MPEIIRSGNPPNSKFHTGTCGNCGCVFRFQAIEAKWTLDGSRAGIVCPQVGCGAYVIAQLGVIGATNA